MMLGEQCLVSDDWEETGRQAELRNIKGVVIMVSIHFSVHYNGVRSNSLQGAHWEKTGEGLVHVSTKADPSYESIAWVDPEKYKNFKVNGSPALGKRVAKLLQNGGVNAIEDPNVGPKFRRPSSLYETVNNVFCSPIGSTTQSSLSSGCSPGDVHLQLSSH